MAGVERIVVPLAGGRARRFCTHGGSGAVFIWGGAGNDRLNGGLGAPDSCDGEAGTDAAIGCEATINVP